MTIAKLFANGQSQAVRLPKEFRFKGKQVFIKRLGSAVVLLPENGSWDPLLQSLAQFTKDFMKNRRQPQQHQKRADLWR